MDSLYSQNRQTRFGRLRRLCQLFLITVLLASLLPLTSCTNSANTANSTADFGTYGSQLAESLASSYPFRSPGSTQEKLAGDYLIKCFKDLGYEPVVTEFTFKDKDGKSGQSRNIVIRIEGSGFTRTDAQGKIENIDKQVIIGAHYDTAVTSEMGAAAKPAATAASAGQNLSSRIIEPTIADYNGIHDNASGIGALLTVAKEMKSAHYGYDVILVAFGAGEADQAGSSFYASQMSKAEIAASDAMYCLDSIYAGDKVYVHSGHNSIKEGYLKDYEKRRKLYEVTDVFYENELYTHNNFMLYTNQSSIDIQLTGFATPVIYREWTQNRSDYLPFDNLGVPIVFFESFNYDKKVLADMKESQNPEFGTTNGQIRKTQYDSAEFLKQILNPVRSDSATSVTSATSANTAGTSQGTAAATATTTKSTITATTSAKSVIDLLTKRINNTAFIILEAVHKGIAGAKAR